MQIKTGDKVKIISGSERGKVGKVIQVFPSLQKIVVEGVKKTKKHLRSRGKAEAGQVIEYSAPISVSGAMLLCGKCGRPTRVGIKTIVEPSGKEKKLRICKKCGENI